MAGVRRKGQGAPLGEGRPFLPVPTSLSLSGEEAATWGAPEGIKVTFRSNKLPFPQLAAILAAPGLQNYFLQCAAPVAAPHLTPFSAWALRHECHLQYLALTLAQRAVGAPVCRCCPFPPLHYPHPASLKPVLLLADHAAPAFLQTCPGLVPFSIDPFAYLFFLAALCFVLSSPHPPPSPGCSVHRQHSSQWRPQMPPSIMAWPWPC